MTFSDYCNPSRLARRYSLVSQHSQGHCFTHFQMFGGKQIQLSCLLTISFYSKPRKALRFIKFPSGSVFFHLWHWGDGASCLRQELLVKPEQFITRSWRAGKSHTSPSPAVASRVCALWCLCAPVLVFTDGRGALRFRWPIQDGGVSFGHSGCCRLYRARHHHPSCKHSWASLLSSQFGAAGCLARAAVVLACSIFVSRFLFV